MKTCGGEGFRIQVESFKPPTSKLNENNFVLDESFLEPHFYALSHTFCRILSFGSWFKITQMFGLQNLCSVVAQFIELELF